MLRVKHSLEFTAKGFKYYSGMTLRDIQTQGGKKLFHSGTEAMLGMSEELGEVATEVALLEQIGSKKFWQKDPSVERLAEEITHLLNCTFALANHFNIDLQTVYENKPKP